MKKNIALVFFTLFSAIMTRGSFNFSGVANDQILKFVPLSGNSSFDSYYYKLLITNHALGIENVKLKRELSCIILNHNKLFETHNKLLALHSKLHKDNITLQRKIESLDDLNRKLFKDKVASDDELKRLRELLYVRFGIHEDNRSSVESES